MIIDEVIRFFLVGYQRGHAFQHEIEIIRSPSRVRGQRGRVKLFQRPYNWVRRINNVFTATQRKPSDPASAGIKNHDTDQLVQYVLMCFDVGARTEHSLFLAGKEYEANGAPRPQARSLDSS